MRYLYDIYICLILYTPQRSEDGDTTRERQSNRRSGGDSVATDYLKGIGSNLNITKYVSTKVTLDTHSLHVFWVDRDENNEHHLGNVIMGIVCVYTLFSISDLKFVITIYK